MSAASSDRTAMPRWSISNWFDPVIFCPVIDDRVRVRVPRRYLFGRSLKINIRKLFEQPFAQHLTEALAPVGDGAILGAAAAKKRSYRGERLSDSLAFGRDGAHHRRSPFVSPC